MIVGIARVLYFLGPILCLAVVVAKKQGRLPWLCWAFSAIIVSLYWIFLLSATGDGAIETSLIPISIWTPMLGSTLIAGLSRNRWIHWAQNPALSQIIVTVLCLIPSAITYFTFI